MPKRIILHIIFALGILSLIKCADKAEPRYANKTIRPGFIKEIPFIKKEGRFVYPEFFYESIHNYAYQLQLDSLETGYDSLEIRIWLGHSLAILKHVVILEYTNQQWRGQLVSFKLADSFDSISNKRTKKITPKSGWKVFADSLNKLQILTLPHQRDVEGLNGGGTDGISFAFEIATQKKYRIYQYSNPEERASFWQAQNVMRIADLLEKEFNFRYER